MSTINVLNNQDFNLLIKGHAKNCNGKYSTLPISDSIGVRCSCGVDIISDARYVRYEYKSYMENYYIQFDQYRQRSLAQRLMEKL